MSCVETSDHQLSRLADAIAQRVGPQRFHVWFDTSTRLDLKQDGLEITVPNDFISEWIGRHFRRPIQEAAHEVLGGPLQVKFAVTPEAFVDALVSPASPTKPASGRTNGNGHGPINGHARGSSTDSADRRPMTLSRNGQSVSADTAGLRPSLPTMPRVRHDLETFVVGPSSQLAYNAAVYVAEYPGGQYNPLFIHGSCGLGKTHLMQGLCKRFSEQHPTKRWAYLSGEEFTNEFLTALKTNKVDQFRRRMRHLDLLVIDDVHFLGGKKATQEEFLHTFNAIEAMGRQVVMASDNHPKLIDEFGESLINRFVSGMVVRIDPPNFTTRCQILQSLAVRTGVALPNDVIEWVARRVTQNVRELEGALTRVSAHARLTGRPADIKLAQEALGDLDRAMVAPIKPECIMQSVCAYFGLEARDLMSGRRQRTISLARSIAMYLVRKTAKLSFPEIGVRMGKRNHSTVISACRRIERAVAKNEPLQWSSPLGERREEAAELIQRLEEHSRTLN